MEPRARFAAVLGTCAVGLVAAALWSGSATSCAATAPEPQAPREGGSKGGSEDPGCARTLAASDFRPVPPAEEPKPPLSRVVVELSVAEAALERVLDARIPKGLGSATRQPIGAPGEVSYTVSRGAPEATLVGDTLEVRVPIHAAVEVCKPIGRLCPTYGTCQPSLVATTRVPLRLGEDYAIEPPKVDVTVTRGCRIAGFDVTSEVQSAAAGARRRAERQIADAIPDVGAALDDAMRGLAQPLTVDGDRCLRVTPRAIRQGAPRGVGDRLEIAFEVEGTVADVSCDARFDAPELPRLTRLEGEMRPSELSTRTLLAGDLTDRLEATAPADVEVGVLRARPHLTPDGSRLAVELELGGAICGRVWGVGQPRIRDDSLVVDVLEPVSTDARGTLDGMSLRVPGVGADDLASRLAERLSDASVAVDGLDDLRAEVSIGEATAEAVVVPRGTAITTRARGRVRIVVAAPVAR